MDRPGERLKPPKWDEVRAKHLSRLDEAARRAENLTALALELQKDLAKRGSRRTYLELASSLGETGASLRHVVGGLRVLLNDAVISDPELRSGSRGVENMEELITGLLATLKQAERLPPSLAKVSGP